MIQIKGKKLFSYLHAFEEILPGQTRVFNKEIITNLLKAGDIFHDEMDDDFTNQYRKIAYMVTYPQDLFVQLIVPTNQEELKTMIIDKHDNVLSYVALFYLNPELVSVDLEGDKKFAKTFFNVSHKEHHSFTKSAYQCLNKSEEIQWVVNENLLLESWRDKEYVLKNLSVENINTNQKLVPAEFWQDADFFKEFLKKYNPHDSKTSSIFFYALNNHKYNEHFLEYMMDSFKSFDNFRTHYFKDYVEYKKGNITHPNQSLLEGLIVRPQTLYSWLRNLYNEDIVAVCFPSHMLETQEIIVEWFKCSLNDSMMGFDPLFKNKYSSHEKPRDFLNEKSSEWKMSLFEKLVDTFLDVKNKSGNYKNNSTFPVKLSFLLFKSLEDINSLFDIVKDFNSVKQNLYMSCFYDYFKNNKEFITLNKDMSEFILNKYPSYFPILDNEYRTLENLKKLVPYQIKVTDQELLDFNDKELNLAVIKTDSYQFINTFKPSYIKDEDYISALIEAGSSYVRDNKNLIKYIEGNQELCKKFIDKGWFKQLSPKVFENIELSEYLIGSYFKNSENKYYKNIDNEHTIKSLVNPVIFSNLDSLEHILKMTQGEFLKEIPHLFKHKSFTKMVFRLFDEREIYNVELLPANVRLILDSYQVKDNFESFFVKYDLQNTLSNKLSENKVVSKVKNKI